MKWKLRILTIELVNGTLKVECEDDSGPVSKSPLAPDGDIDPHSGCILYIADVALKLRKSKKQIDKLSRRRKNPLPLTRGKGRPFVFESTLHQWLASGGPKPPRLFA